MCRVCLPTLPAKDGFLTTTTKRVGIDVLARATMSSMGYLSARLASPRGACTELTSLLPCSHALMLSWSQFLWPYGGQSSTEELPSRTLCMTGGQGLHRVPCGMCGMVVWPCIRIGIIASVTDLTVVSPLRLFPLWAQTRHSNQASAWLCVLYHAVLAVRVTQETLLLP